MAEYMDISRIDDWDNLSIIDDDGCAKYVYDVGELSKADVVERSEYKKLKQQLDEEHEMSVKAANNLLDVLGKLDLQKKENAELRSKIDKAIEEMEKFKEDVASTNDLYAQSCVKHCIATFKRNIGE